MAAGLGRKRSGIKRGLVWLLPLTMALGACSEKPSDDGPAGIDAKGAPTVAFTYFYRFLVPTDDLAGLQEQHAAACERLGPARCRITGMHFQKGGRDNVWGSLDMLLDRDLARGFGRDGIAAITRAGGRLQEATIEGTDKAETMADDKANGENLAQQRDALAKRLAQPGLGDRERTELTQQIAQAESQAQAVRASQAATQAQLANTPMHFAYDGAPAMALSDNPFADALQTLTASGRAVLYTVLMGLGFGLPWLALGLALIAIWRSGAIRRLRNYVTGAER